MKRALPNVLPAWPLLLPLLPVLRLLPLLLLLLLLLLATRAPAQAPPPPDRELRGIWVATVDNIDFPSRPGLPAAALRAELRAIVERTAALRCNALVFQVRPCGDAMYRSELEPWSEWLTGQQGKAPPGDFDPLQELLDLAHPRGIEVHAWCNPYRARHPASKSPEHARHVIRRLPDAVVTYGPYRWMDPGDDRARDFTLRVIADVVARYDVDAVHLDDYFYPYPEKGQDFPDDATFARYRQGGGMLSRGDWRRRNIDGFVQRLYEQTHASKPAVLVGISPFGIARPGVPAGIKAGIDQYDQLYADVLHWQRQGWLDYLTPQLYWPIDQKAQSFAVLLPWWFGQNPRQRHVWPGINPGRAAEHKKPWREDELVEQIELIRAQRRDAGHVHFSYRALRGDGNGLAPRLLAAVYQEPALPPASPWLGGPVPGAPKLEVRSQDGRTVATWLAVEHARKFAVQVLQNRRWQMLAVTGPGPGAVVLPAGTTRVAVRAVGAQGLDGPPAVRDL